MMQIFGRITTVHADAKSVARSLAPDNLRGMTTVACNGRVVTELTGSQARSVIASVDDYLTNLAIADEVTTIPQHTGTNSRTEQKNVKS